MQKTNSQLVKNKFIFLAFCILIFHIVVCKAETSDYCSVNNILYRDIDEADSDTCIQSKCRLDVYSPTKKTAQYTLIFFHGGGLTSGQKFTPGKLQDKNLNIVRIIITNLI